MVLERHPKLYLANGDVILQAKLLTASEGVKLQLYCVHKVVLGFHSAFFANLFADGSAPPEATYDGRPVVEMHDDANDLYHLLRFIYKPVEYFLRSSHSDTALKLRGAARLAGKYLMDDALSDMIHGVIVDWPTTMDDWVAYEGQLQILLDTHQHCYPDSEELRIAERTPEPLSAIVFAQEFGCKEILPAAFYRLASIEFNSEWDAEKSYLAWSLRARWSLCDRDTLARWINGRIALEAYHSGLVSRLNSAKMLHPSCLPWWLRDEVDSEDAEEDATEIVERFQCYRLVQTLGELARSNKPTYDPLTTLARLETHLNDAVINACADGLGLCRDCRKEAHRWLRGERARLWRILPQLFDL